MAELHPAAEQEMYEAARWYELEEPGVGLRFLDAVDDALGLIALHPGVGAPRHEHEGVRSFKVRRFPYVVIYVDTSPPQVYAIAHTRRQPAYWAVRLP